MLHVKRSLRVIRMDATKAIITSTVSLGSEAGLNSGGVVLPFGNIRSDAVATFLKDPPEPRMTC